MQHRPDGTSHALHATPSSQAARAPPLGRNGCSGVKPLAITPGDSYELQYHVCPRCEHMMPAAAAGPGACSTRGISGGSGSDDGTHTGMPCGGSSSRSTWVLELACGTGSSCVHMARVMKGSQVIGVDLVQGAVEESRRRADAAGVHDACSFMQASNKFDFGC